MAAISTTSSASAANSTTRSRYITNSLGINRQNINSIGARDVTRRHDHNQNRQVLISSGNDTRSGREIFYIVGDNLGQLHHELIELCVMLDIVLNTATIVV
jgi:hypothetical protein